MNKKRFIAWIAAALLLLTAAGCGGTEEANHSAAGKTFVMGDTTFNPENNEPDISPTSIRTTTTAAGPVSATA